MEIKTEIPVAIPVIAPTTPLPHSRQTKRFISAVYPAKAVTIV